MYIHIGIYIYSEPLGASPLAHVCPFLHKRPLDGLKMASSLLTSRHSNHITLNQAHANISCVSFVGSYMQDDVPPFPDDIAYDIIRSELGRPMEEVFSSISEKPIAAASLGQVGRGRPTNQVVDVGQV